MAYAGLQRKALEECNEDYRAASEVRYALQQELAKCTKEQHAGMLLAFNYMQERCAALGARGEELATYIEELEYASL